MTNDTLHEHLAELAVALGIGLAAVAPGGVATAAVGDDGSASSSAESSDSDSSRGDTSERDSSGSTGREETSDDGTTAGEASESGGTSESDGGGIESGNDDIETGDSEFTPGVDVGDADSTTDTTTNDGSATPPTELEPNSGTDTTDPDTATTIGSGNAPSDEAPFDDAAAAGDSVDEDEPLSVLGDTVRGSDLPSVDADIHLPSDHHSAIPATPATAPPSVVTAPDTVATTRDSATAIAANTVPALTVPTSDGIPTAAAPLTAWAHRALAEAPRMGMKTLAPALPLETADVVTGVVSKVLGAIGLRPYLSGDPLAPVESPMFWALAAAWCRRQEKAPAVEAARGFAADPVTTSQPIEPLALATSRASETSSALASASLTSGPTIGVPDRATGRVLGSLGTAGSYTVAGQPSRGTVTLDAAGGFTYTPTQAARASAALDPGADYDSFTVTQSGSSTPVTVRVPVSAAWMQVTQSTTVGTTPSGAAIAGTRTYVANQGSRTVSVLDANNAVVGTVAVGTNPTGVAANPAGTRVYVTNSGSNTVSVINTATNTVAATVRVGTSPNAVTVNPTGTRAYVTNAGSGISQGTVSVINTATSRVVATVNTGAGSTPNAVAVNPAGTRAYVTAAGSATSPAGVTVIDTTTNKVVTTIRAGIGNTPNAVAVSPDGTRVYVTNRGSGTVSVIDTATNAVVRTVAVGSRPTAVRVTPDGSAAYVVSDPDTLTVIDTRTNTVVTTLGVDSSAESGAHSVALTPDGARMLITDASDGQVRALALTHVNSAPTATWTVGEPRASDGAVVVTLQPTDPADGDPVTFTYSAPQSGTVVADGASTLTYTPTAAARDSALITAGPDADQFTLSVDDGQAVTTLVVTVPVTPTETVGLDIATISVGSGPSAAVALGDHIYVVTDDGHVFVIDRETNTVVGTPIAVDWAPTSIAAAPAVERVYVDSAYMGTVSVIDTATGTVVGTLWLPVDAEFQGMSLAQELAVSSDGTRLYTSGEDGTVSVVDTATGTVVDSSILGYFTDLDVGSDGRHLFGASGATISVIDTATLTATAVLAAGPAWDQAGTSSEYTDTVHQVAVSPDGTRVYATYHVHTVELASGGYSNGWFVTDSTGRLWLVTGGYEAVAVIDNDPQSATYGAAIATTRPVGGAQGLTLSPDGSLAYVGGGDGRTVTVLDTDTLTVVRTFETDANGSSGGRAVLLADDTLYVTDPQDGAVYAVTGLPAVTSAAMAA